MNPIKFQALTARYRQLHRTTYSPNGPAPAASATIPAEGIALMKDIDRMMAKSSSNNTSVADSSSNKRKRSFTIYEDDDNPPATVQREETRVLKRRKDNGNAWHVVSARDTAFNEFLDLFDREDYREALNNNTFRAKSIFKIIRMGTRGLGHPLKNIDCETLEIFISILFNHKDNLLENGAPYHDTTRTRQPPLPAPQDKFEVGRLMYTTLFEREPASVDRAIKALDGTFELCSKEYLEREENKENVGAYEP